MDNKIRLLVLEALLKRAEKKTIIKESLYAWVKGAAEATKIAGKTLRELIAISLVAIRRSIDVGGVIKLTSEQMDSLEQFIANSKKAIRGIDFNAKTVNINEFRDSLSEIFYENRKWDSLADNEKSVVRSYLANPEDLANAIDHTEKALMRTAFDASEKVDAIAREVIRANLATTKAGGKITEESIKLQCKAAIGKLVGRPVSDTLMNQIFSEVVPQINNKLTREFLESMSALPEAQWWTTIKRSFLETLAPEVGTQGAKLAVTTVKYLIIVVVIYLAVKAFVNKAFCPTFGDWVGLDFCRQEGAKPTRFR